MLIADHKVELMQIVIINVAVIIHIPFQIVVYALFTTLVKFKVVGDTVQVVIYVVNIVESIAIRVDHVRIKLGKIHSVVLSVVLCYKNEHRIVGKSVKLCLIRYLAVYRNGTVAVLALLVVKIVSRGRDNGHFFAKKFGEIFIFCIAITVFAVPILLATLEHTGGRIVFCVTDRTLMAAIRVVEIALHLVTDILNVGAKITETEFPSAVTVCDQIGNDVVFQINRVIVIDIIRPSAAKLQGSARAVFRPVEWIAFDVFSILIGADLKLAPIRAFGVIVIIVIAIDAFIAIGIGKIILAAVDEHTVFIFRPLLITPECHTESICGDSQSAVSIHPIGNLYGGNRVVCRFACRYVLHSIIAIAAFDHEQ